MAIILASNFEYKGKLPHFSNDQFATVADMKAYSENFLADGQISYCVETKKHYAYKSTNTVDATTGKWRILVEDVDAAAVTSDTVKRISIGGTAITPISNNINFYQGNGIQITQSTGSTNTIDFNVKSASTSQAGIVQLNNTLTSTSTAQALTAAQGKALNDAITTANGKITTNTTNITNLTNKVNALGSAYRVKGTKATIAEVVALTDAVVGDVWNVTAAFTLSGKPYPAGTNVVCVTATTSSAHTEACWDAIGGTVDLSPYAKSAEVVASGEMVQTATDTAYFTLKNKAGTTLSTVGIDSVTTSHAGLMTAGQLQSLQGLISGDVPAAKATVLANVKAIDGVYFDGSASITHYGVCTTAAATAAKTVAVTNYASSSGIHQGCKVHVRFTNTNSAANATLNVNNTGAKPIYYGSSAIPANKLTANRVYTLVYDTTLVTSGAWLVVGEFDNNTTYSAFKGATASAAGSQGLVPAPTSGKVNQVLRSDGTWADASSIVNTADSFNRVLKINNVVSGVTVQAASTTDPNAIVYFNNTTNRFIAGVTVDGTTTYYNNWNGAREFADSDYYGTAKADNGVYDPAYRSVLVELNSGELRRYGWDTTSQSTTIIDNVVVSTAKKLQTARAIDGVTFDGSVARHHLSTNISGDPTKGYTCSLTGFVLTTGSRVSIKTPGKVLVNNIPMTLNVGNSGAKPILVDGSAAGATKWFPSIMASGMVVDAVYDGTNWNIIGAFTSEPTLQYDTVSTVNDIVLS